VARVRVRRADEAPSTGLTAASGAAAAWGALHLPDAATADGLLVEYSQHASVAALPMRGLRDIHDLRAGDVAPAGAVRRHVVVHG
jgi:hypothetical protein